MEVFLYCRATGCDSVWTVRSSNGYHPVFNTMARLHYIESKRTHIAILVLEFSYFMLHLVLPLHTIGQKVLLKFCPFLEII
jgi:uncharacterized protein YceK